MHRPGHLRAAATSGLCRWRAFRTHSDGEHICSANMHPKGCRGSSREDNVRLSNRVAIVVGAGQSPGEGIGNGRATALIFAREGACVLCVDHKLDSAQETVDLIAAKGGTARAFKADVTSAADIAAM